MPDMTPEEFVKHHGVKGMHWGIRKAREESERGSSGDKPSESHKAHGSEDEAKKQYMAISPIRRNKAQIQKALEENHNKFAAKFESSDGGGEKKGLSPGQKKALKIGIGVAAVGGIIALGVYTDRQNQGFADELSSIAGRSVDVGKFEKGVNLSKLETWGKSGYIQPSSYEREEFSLPAGHTFHRISQAAEKEFNDATYSTPDIDDFNRYVVGFRGEKAASELHHVTFSAKEPIKVPSLTTALEAFRESLSKEYERASPERKKVLDEIAGSKGHASKENALALYESMSGGSWNSNRAKAFMDVLKTKGYDAIVDEMDAGVIGDKPLVIFNHDKMGPKSSKPLTNEIISSAEKELKELTSRKLGVYGKKTTTMAASEEIEAFLAHHGIKGMRWGVRKERDSESSEKKSFASNSWTPENEQKLKRDYQAIPAVHRTPKAAAKNFEVNQKKFEAKFEPSEVDKSDRHLTEGQKKALKIGVGVAAVGGLAALAYYTQKNGSGLNVTRSNVLPGEHVSISDFEKRINQTQHDFWGSSDFSTPESFERSEITIPAGHVFHRLSRGAEKEFGNATYTSGDLDDFNRYVVTHSAADAKSVFEGHYHVTFSAKESLKIPSLTTSVEILRQQMSEGKANQATQKEALDLYNAMSGGSWNASGAEKFVQALKAKGYDGLIDEMDHGVVSDSPFVLFSSEKMSDKVAKKLTDKDVVYATKNLKELKYRKTLDMAASDLAESMNENVEEFLAHFGVKGMHWGVHHAKADAHEFVKAKLSYGEGAGTRRKLIKAKVEARSKKSPEYKKAFDEHVTKFSMKSDRLAKQATINRNVKATRKSTVKTVKGVHRSLTGGFGSVSLASATIAGAYVYARKTGLDQKIISLAQEGIKNAKKPDYSEVASWLKSQGVG